MDFWTIFIAVGVGATYAVAGGMLSLFLIGTWRRRSGKGLVMDLAFAAVLVGLPLLLGLTETEKAATCAGWAVGGTAAFVYGLVVLRADEDGGEEPA